MSEHFPLPSDNETPKGEEYIADINKDIEQEKLENDLTIGEPVFKKSEKLIGTLENFPPLEISKSEGWGELWKALKSHHTIESRSGTYSAEELISLIKEVRNDPFGDLNKIPSAGDLNIREKVRELMFKPEAKKEMWEERVREAQDITDLMEVITAMEVVQGSRPELYTAKEIEALIQKGEDAYVPNTFGLRTRLKEIRQIPRKEAA